MEYARTVDYDSIAKAKADARITQALVDATTGIKNCLVNVVRVPPGGGSPAGRHKHVFDQMYYVISGTMGVEIDGNELTVGPGAAVSLPAGVPHRNWNNGEEPLVHLAIFVPPPDPDKPLAIPVND